MFGAHHAVAAEINMRRTRAPANTAYLCCDDCSIEEFSSLLQPHATDVFVADPRPSFAEAVIIAITLAEQIACSPASALDCLQRNPDFRKNQFQHAGFTIKPIEINQKI
ncbi:MAG: hypothetical protein AAGJ87_00135 [Pseudomonadota bacterium]